MTQMKQYCSLVTIISGLLLFASLAQAQNKKFKCDGSLYLSQNDFSAPTELKSIEKGATVKFKDIATYSVYYNSIGFNKDDNYIYGITADESIIRIFSDGTFEKIGSVSTPQANLNSGAFNNQGDFYVGKHEDFYKIDVSGAQAQVIEHITLTFENRGGTPKFSDVAFYPNSNTLFGFDKTTQRLCSVDVNTGEVTPFGQQENLSVIGGLFFDASNQLYGYQDNKLYKINLNTGEVNEVATGPSAKGKDGCACPYSLDVYKTLSPEEACPGDTLDMKITLVNNSDEKQDDLIFKDYLPNNATFVSDPSSVLNGNVKSQSGKGYDSLIIEGFTLPTGVSEFNVKIKLPDSYSRGSFANQGFISNMPEYLTDTIFSDDTSTVKGDDSTKVMLNDAVNKTYTAHICEGETYDFGSRTLSSEGTYEDTLYPSNGCTRVFATLNLNVHSEFSDTVNRSICEGESLEMGGNFYEDSGTYLITDTTRFGCDSSIQLNLDVHPHKALSFDTALCTGRAFSYKGQHITQPGVYEDTLQTSKGCDSVIEINVESKQTPKVNLADTSVCDFTGVKASVEEYDKVLWNTGANGREIDIPEPGQYWVQVTASNDCTAEDSMRVELECPTNIYIPNTFSPNDDGSNEVFMVKGNNIQNFNMQIYNRWGERLFESNSLENAWDGTFKGEPVPTGIYLYVITYKEMTENGIYMTRARSGTIKVIR